jgi:glycosyltransferase involved in cell wall biosynthesis
VFLGYRFGAELAWHMAAADVFVFPSRTDTFGIVMLESMACGVPVAAYPVQGPLDVVRNGVTGILDEDLATAVQRALRLESAQCRAFAQLQSWERCTRQFIGHLAPAVERPAPQRPRVPEQGGAVAQLKKG